MAIRYIIGAVLGVVSVVITAVAFPILLGAADTYYLTYTARCEVGNERFVRLYSPGTGTGELSGAGTAVSAGTSGTCATTAAIPGTAAGDTTARTEHGIDITVASPNAAIATIANTKWVTALAITTAYNGISTLILSVLPILSVIVFLGISASNIYTYAQGQNVQMMVIGTIGTLILIIVGLFLAPTVFVFLNAAYLVATDGRFSITAQFGTIIKLIMEFAPPLYNAGLIGLFAAPGYFAYQRIGRGGVSYGM